MCSVTDRSRSDGIQPVDEQPYTVDKFSCAGAPSGRGLTKLGEQLAERGQLHAPVSFLQLIPELARGLQSRDVHTDMRREVPEDDMVGLGFAPRPFLVALESLGLHFEAGLDGSLPHRPIKVGLHQRSDIRGDWLCVFELAIWTLEVAGHYVPDLPGFQVRSHEALPGSVIIASCQRLDGCDGSVE
jgi:hypothetical protein